MQVTINANGKAVQVEITKEQAKILGLVEERSRTGYERGEECNNKKYYFVNTIDLVIEDENTVLFDQNRYDVGNYYSDKTIAENNARADRLLRCLRQWQALNDKPISQSDWEDNGKSKWCIMYSYGAEELYVNNFYYTRLPNVIYFTTQEKAEEAIEVFKDELLWYFTEYQQRLDEVCD